MALARQAAAVAAGSAGGGRPLVQLPGRVPRAAEDVHPARRRRPSHGDPRAEAAVRDRSGRPRVRAHRQPRRPALPGHLRHRHGDRRAPARAQARALVQRPVARREVVPLLRGRQLPRLLDGVGPDAQHHAQCPDLVRRHRRRPQRRQAAGRIDWMDEGQRVGAPDRQLGHLAGAGRGRHRGRT